MFCAHCGSKITDNTALFCSKCGAKIVVNVAGNDATFDAVSNQVQPVYNPPDNSGNDAVETFDVISSQIQPVYNHPVHSGDEAVETFEVVGNQIQPVYNPPVRSGYDAVKTLDAVRAPFPPIYNKPVHSDYWDIDDEIQRSNNTKKIIIAAVVSGLCICLFCGIGILVTEGGRSNSSSGVAESVRRPVAPPKPAEAPRLPEPRNEQVILPPDQFDKLLGEVVKISATEMNNLYNANKIGYENRFGGKYFIITGRISQIRPAYIGSTSIVELSVPDYWNDDIRVVYPGNISDVEREYIGSLRTGYRFEAFVRGQTNRPGYVDVVCKSTGGQIRTVTFNPTAPPTTNEYGRAAAEHLTEATEQSIKETAEFIEGFLEGLLGQ